MSKSTTADPLPQGPQARGIGVSTDDAGVAASIAAAARAAKGASTVRGMLWMAAGGLALATMNGLMRKMTLELDPAYAQFLRYLFAVPMMLPLLLRQGAASFRTTRPWSQLTRGLVHTVSLALFFFALPHLALADVTAIMFTTPIFVLIGAALVLRESVSAARWGAAAVGFGGVLIVMWPHLGGSGSAVWSLVMLGASPLFAASFLMNKSLTRHDSPTVIVMWQNVTVTLFTFPLAIPHLHALTPTQFGVFVACGFLGTVAHLCMTRGLSIADISAMQSVRFLDLIWASVLGLILFDTSPTVTALVGGAVILASTIWIARRESAR